MTLVPVPDKPGLSKNPGWVEGSPGVFALVIGVSDYKHLPELDPSKTDPKFGVAEGFGAAEASCVGHYSIWFLRLAPHRLRSAP